MNKETKISELKQRREDLIKDINVITHKALNLLFEDKQKEAEPLDKQRLEMQQKVDAIDKEINALENEKIDNTPGVPVNINKTVDTQNSDIISVNVGKHNKSDRKTHNKTEISESKEVTALLFLYQYVKIFESKQINRTKLIEFWKDLERAISLRLVDKTAEIKHIAETLKKFDYSKKQINEQKTFINQISKQLHKKRNYIYIINRYNTTIKSGEPTKEKVNAVIRLINKYVKERRVSRDQVTDILNNLEYFKTHDLNVNDKIIKSLNGLGTINSTDLKKATFKTFVVTDPIFIKTLGPEIEEPFYLMTYGAGGAGKSTYSVLLAKYFANNNRKVLFVPVEEKISQKLQDKFERLEAFHRNIAINQNFEKAEKSFSNYDIVVIDSITALNLTPENFEKLQKKHPKTSFVLIFQSIKTGNFRGDNGWEHLCDIKHKFEYGIITPEKSRFGGNQQTKIY
jgi:hypothetical protein